MADEPKKPNFDRSLALTERLHRLIPGGAHTYAKGDDQYPADTPPILVRGEGARVWDADGNEMLEYGMGLRAVSLGHAFPAVNDAAARQMRHGSNFSRPALLELEWAEALLDLVGGDMVKVDTILRRFESQASKTWFTADTFNALMRIRGVECRSRTGYAEAFYARKIVVLR